MLSSEISKVSTLSTYCVDVNSVGSDQLASSADLGLHFFFKKMYKIYKKLYI